jgi:UDP-N-acetylglucosamine--N-acetylmuramyl-(pentapeptide) pyrophosphoryl-undecaprenol N-acetylglucosamine transferase
LISGGGTGGHIYPAIAIANAWLAKHPTSKLLFVGALGKMEMQKVPEAGYQIIGLPIVGIQRSLTLDNLKFPWKLLKSLRQASKIVGDFKPDAVVGVGGYASGPVLYAAQRKGIPTLVQEQNSYAGLTNKILAKKAGKICVAYPGMDQFFPAERIAYTGNPVRKDILDLTDKRETGLSHFKLNPAKKTILVLGGSLGAQTLNQAVLVDMKLLDKAGYQVLWQCGKFYFSKMLQETQEADLSGIHLREFIREMDLAYAVADVIVSRAGALSVSELSLVGKPVIFVPSPNVVADHQTKNAMTYVAHQAAWILKDDEAVGQLKSKIEELLSDPEQAEALGLKIKELAKPNAATAIVEELELLIK